MTVQRANGGGTVVLPAAYVAEHVELAYASSAHRAQGRTVDTAHALVSSTTTREVLYVWPPGAASPTSSTSTRTTTLIPQTSHDQASEPVTAKEVLAGVLRNEGADVAAHDMIRRQQSEAEGMERLSAEYLTLATLAQARALGRPARPLGLHRRRPRSRSGQRAHGPLLAAFREAEARGLDVEAPSLAWWPAGHWPTPPTWPRCCTAGWSVGPRRPAAAAGGRQPDRRAHPPGPRCQRPRDGPGVWPSGTRPWKSAPVRWPTKPSEPRELGATSRDPASNPGPTGSAGCAKSRPSPPTGTAGTSPARALSASRATRAVSSRRVNASGRRPQLSPG
jgi:hypothetical protein